MQPGWQFTVNRLGAAFLRRVVQSPAGTRNLSHFESNQTLVLGHVHLLIR
jgi:hypothetical protein